jgi:hypothetical protein
MENLAGNRECDRAIRKELEHARIPIVEVSQNTGEVPYSLVGELGPFKFRRAWYYWVVEGRMPLAAAQELYADPAGRDTVRVCGDCTCPAPVDHHITWRNEAGKELLDFKNRDEFAKLAENHRSLLAKVENDYVFVEDPAAAGVGFIETYHVDSVLGLRLVADAIRKHVLKETL